MITLPNWILVSGTGRNVGKTTLVCKIISRVKELDPVAVKISSHIHTLPDDSDWIVRENDFSVIRETQLNSKDSSRMLSAGAGISLYAQGPVHRLPEILNCLTDITEGKPVICESGGLRNLMVPGIYFLVKGDERQLKPGISGLENLADRVVSYPEIITEEIENRISFRNGKWILNY